VYGRKVDGQSHHRRQTNPRIVDDYDRIFILTTLFRVPSEWGAPVEDTLCVSAPFVRWVVRPQRSWVIVTSSKEKKVTFSFWTPLSWWKILFLGRRSLKMSCVPTQGRKSVWQTVNEPYSSVRVKGTVENTTWCRSSWKASQVESLVLIPQFVHYETIKRELNKRLMYECRCDERLKAKTEGSPRAGIFHKKKKQKQKWKLFLSQTDKELKGWGDLNLLPHGVEMSSTPTQGRDSRMCVSDRQWTIFISTSKRNGGKRDVVSVDLEAITGGVVV